MSRVIRWRHWFKIIHRISSHCLWIFGSSIHLLFTYEVEASHLYLVAKYSAHGTASRDFYLYSWTSINRESRRDINWSHHFEPTETTMTNALGTWHLCWYESAQLTQRILTVHTDNRHEMDATKRLTGILSWSCEYAIGSWYFDQNREDTRTSKAASVRSEPISANPWTSDLRSRSHIRIQQTAMFPSCKDIVDCTRQYWVPSTLFLMCPRPLFSACPHLVGAAFTVIPST